MTSPVPDAALALDGGLRLRTLTLEDAGLVAEATRAETSRSPWDACPVGPYGPADARAALRGWQPGRARQVSYGLIGDGRPLAAFGLMFDDDLPAERPDAPGDGPDGAVLGAELAYWVRPENRRRGLALRGVRALTGWAHGAAGLPRLWLEINPADAPSRRLAARAGYLLQRRLARHCRDRRTADPALDTWHDCLIWSHHVDRADTDGRPAPAPAET